jgi:hypothetical protein
MHKDWATIFGGMESWKVFDERLESRGKAKVAALKFSPASLSLPFHPRTEGLLPVLCRQE